MNNVHADVVRPVPSDFDGLAKVVSFIESHEARHGSDDPAFFLSSSSEDDRVKLTEQLHEIFKRVVHALSEGQTISILARDEEISTQQAAEILGLSRPTVVRLIGDGELRAHVPGKVRRKLRLADVLAYRETLRDRRNRFITETAAEFDDFTGEEIAAALAEVRRNAR